MPLTQSERYKKHEPVVLTDEFIVTFPVFDTDDLDVFLDGIETEDYSVTATFTDGVSTDATITLSAAVTDVDVEIYGARAPRSESSYVNSSPDLAGQVQLDMERITVVQQEQSRDYARALKIGAGSSIESLIPSPTEPGQVLISNAGNTGFEFSTQSIADMVGFSELNNVQSLEDLALAPRVNGMAQLTSIGIAGSFAWRSGDYSTEVSDDTLSAVYVAATGVDASVGCWVRVFDGPLQSSWFGITPHVSGDVITDHTDALEAMTNFAAKYFHHVQFQPGHYYFNKWLLKRGVKYEGLGAVENMRAGITSGSEYDEMLLGLSGVVFIAMGNDAIEFQIDRGMTAGKQCGYDRTLSTATVGVEGYDDIHPSATTPFTVAEHFDATNQDAVGTTKATLKTLRAAAYMEDSWSAIQIDNLRFVSSNATTDDPVDALGDHYGLTGYTDSAAVYEIPDYHFGFFYRNGWNVKFLNTQVVGYWRGVGTMFFLPPADGFTSVTANSEQGKVDNCAFQSGIEVRSGELWPVVDKSGNDIYVRWTASHHFDPTGTLNISDGDTFNNSSEYAYTALAYSTSATPNTGATGQFLVFTLSDASAISAGDKIETHIAQGGISHTKFENCRVADVAHLTGLDLSSDELAPYFDRYIPAFVISGAPMRALQFQKCVFNAMSPVIGMVGAARDLEFWGCYAEGKSFKWTLAGSLESHRGGVFIAGPTSSGTYADEVGNAGSAQIYIEVGRPWNSTVSIAPMYEPRAGRRLSTMTDVFNPILSRLDAWTREPSDNAYRIELLAAQQMLIESQNAAYELTQMLRIWQVGDPVHHILDMGYDGSGGHLLRLRSNGTADFTVAPSVNGNTFVNSVGGVQLRVLTSAQIGDASHEINTTGKAEGVAVFGSDTNKLYIALAGASTSTWADMEGTANITPT